MGREFSVGVIPLKGVNFIAIVVSRNRRCISIAIKETFLS